MEGEEGGDATTDTGASSTDTTDTSVDSDAGDGGSSGEEGGDASAAAKAEAKFKVRRYGKEAEYTAAEMAKMLDDDHEWDFHGAGGKPLLRDGQPVKQKWRDIVRSVQQSHGAAEAARRYNEQFKQISQIAEWAKHKNETGEYQNLDTFMQDHLGIEDFDTWALQRAAKAFDRREKLGQLAMKDPLAYERELRGDLEKRDQRRREALQRQQQQQGQQAERAQREQAFYGRVAESFKPFGVPMNARTKEIVDQVVQEYVDVNAELPFETLAEIVRDQYHDEIFGYLDPKPDEELLKVFGDKRRERLRNAELVAHKQKKAVARQEAPKPASNGQKRKPMTAAEFLAASRRS